MEILFENDWMKIIKQDDKYIIQYDSGDLIGSIQEVVVSESDAKIALESVENADQIIMKYLNIRDREHPRKPINIVGLDD